MTTSGPMLVKLKFIHRDRDRHGNVRVYFWRKGQSKIRMRAEPGTPEFHEVYRDLLTKSAAGSLVPIIQTDRHPTHGTWRWLSEQYMRSADFRRLDPQTQRTRRGILEKTYSEPTRPGSELLFGEMPIRAMRARTIKVLRDRKGAFIEAANSRLKAVRRVFSWAIDDEIECVTTNPAKDVKYLSSGSAGFHTWTPEEVEQFEARHAIGTKARLAMALLAFTGVRRSDVVLLGRQHARAGWLKFTTHKGRNRKPIIIDIPILPELRDVIDACPTGDLTFLVTEYRKPFTAAGFGNWFRDRCNEAGLPQCSAHGLRKAGATRAAENGATTKQLQAIFGWVTTKEPERYTEAANRKRLSETAPQLLRRSKPGTKVSHSGGG